MSDISTIPCLFTTSRSKSFLGTSQIKVTRSKKAIDFINVDLFSLSLLDNVHGGRCEILFGRTCPGPGTSAQSWHNLSRPKAGKVNTKFIGRE